MKDKTKIRFLKRGDLDELVVLIANHAAYEQSEFSDVGKKETLEAHLFGDTPPVKCLVAELEGVLVGYTTYAKQYSTWDAYYYYYMDCLYLEEDARGHGLGERLVNRIKEEAVTDDVHLLQWQTPEFNVRAIKFYHRIGATSKSKERFFLKID